MKRALDTKERNEIMIKFTEHHWCCCFATLFPRRFTLTRSALTIYVGKCIGGTKSQIDVSAFTDIRYEDAPCRGKIMIDSMDPSDPYIEFYLLESEAKKVYQKLRDAWELNQDRMAMARTGDLNKVHR
jgi:hypothetical protein